VLTPITWPTDEHLSQLAWYGPAEADPPQLVFNQKCVSLLFATLDPLNSFS
jgi:hypothetical protein